MHNFTYKLTGLVVTAGIITTLSAQSLQAGEPAKVDGIITALSAQQQQAGAPASLKQNQKAGSPIKQVGFLNDKCGCKQKHVYSYSDNAAYASSNCPHCRYGSSVRSGGIGKRGSLLDFFRCKKKFKAKGVAPIGRYNITYAVDPYQFDQRDGRLYGAQGYGVPIAVPLAPNVRQTYNYGWGIPSSRITPISRIVQ